MQVTSTDASSLHKRAYLILLKRKLISHAREVYNYSAGGKSSVEQYNLSCYQIKKAKNLGALLRIAHDMNMNVSEAVYLILFPLVEGISRVDMLDMPESW
jgi:hypothetical protein